jgi:hypothetical protein
MVITNQHQQAGLGTAGQEVPHPAAGDGARPMAARLTTEQVWHQIAKASLPSSAMSPRPGSPAPAGWSTRPLDGGCMWRSPRQLEGQALRGQPAGRRDRAGDAGQEWQMTNEESWRSWPNHAAWNG